MVTKIKLCVITSSRADYGLLSHLMNRIKNSSKFQLQIIATGSHLSKQHGYTLNQIIQDGFVVDDTIDLKIKTQDINNVTECAGTAVSKIAQSLMRLKPDAVLVLGDRYEIASAAVASALCIIPVVHFHGGEITEGANDDMFRHAITKFSSLHFVSTSQYKNRVIQLGEQPKNVIVSGALGIEGIKKLKLKSKKELEKILNIKFKKRVFLITYHPETMGKIPAEKLTLNLLNALQKFSETTFIITKANADVNGNLINNTIKKFIKSKNDFHLFSSLGQINFLSLMKCCDMVIGNSSSGIIEAPSFNKININIGNRQKGRITAKSNIDCKSDEMSIYNAVKKGIETKLLKTINPYDHGNASEIIMKKLEKTNFEKLLPKTFYNLN